MFKLMISVMSLIVLSITELQAMVATLREVPINQWSRVRHLNTEESINCYNSLWNPGDTLENNCNNMVKQFIDNCCDFSFMKQENRGFSKVNWGILASGEQVVCPMRGVSVFIRNIRNKVYVREGKLTEELDNTGLVRNVRNKVYIREGRSIEEISDIDFVRDIRNKVYIKEGELIEEIDDTSLFLPGVHPLDFTDEMKDTIKSQIQEISRDSVGCEFLRTMVAKYKTKDYPRIKFIPIKSDIKGVDYVSSGKMSRRLSNGASVPIYYFKRNNAVVFSSNWISNRQTWFTVTEKRENGEDVLTLNDMECAKDAQLLHCMLHALHDDLIEKSNSTSCIISRSCDRYFRKYIPNVGVLFMNGKDLNSWVYVNDENFRTLLGITCEGLDTLCEARYTAHKYGYIRLALLDGNKTFKYNKKVLDRENAYDLLGEFVEFNSDAELIDTYLSSSHRDAGPEFGEGAYQYSNVSK